MQWHTPIGYKVLNGKIVVYEEHRKIVEQIFRDYDSGISALRIAKDLKDRGIKNAHDRVSWTHASVGRILENYNYLGTEDYEQLIDNIIIIQQVVIIAHFKLLLVVLYCLLMKIFVPVLCIRHTTIIHTL